jgi:acyl-CoA reductase-like NAD-dependent aldehyde dehydrogenase
MGPLASSAALDLLDHQVADAVVRGARLILGGKRMAATDGNFYLPTLLVDVPNDAEVMQAESFGPKPERPQTADAAIGIRNGAFSIFPEK